jgi:hypothetical protein
MHNPGRFAKGWQVVFGKYMGVRLTRRWLFPVAILTLVLGIGISFPPTVVQAQDGGTRSGQQISAHFVLQVDTSDPKLNKLCLGENVLLPVRVALEAIEFTGGGDVGDYTVRSAELDPTVANPSIVSVVQSSWFFGDPAPNTPFQTALQLTGEEIGSTTITINATIRSSVIYSLHEEVALPMSDTSQARPVSVPVRVVPCAFRVTINSIWETSMHGSFTILIANVRNARLTGGQTNTLEFEPPLAGPPFLEWTWANNRIIGCWASGGHFSTRAPTIRATRLENNVQLTINYAQAVPGGPTSHYYTNLCLPHFTVGTSRCEERPDGYCWTWPTRITHDWFEPQQLDGENLLFGLDGGTQNATHLINHSWGSANGTTIITLTPERLQQ